MTFIEQVCWIIWNLEYKSSRQARSSPRVTCQHWSDHLIIRGDRWLSLYELRQIEIASYWIAEFLLLDEVSRRKVESTANFLCTQLLAKWSIYFYRSCLFENQEYVSMNAAAFRW